MSTSVYLPLTNSKLEVILDQEDYIKLKKYKWSIGKNGYVRPSNGEGFLLHRKILNITDKKIHIDHINDNKLDNRKKNLRICNNQQNTSNKKKLVGNFTSKYKGVSWEKRVKKWRSTITYYYKQVHIGTFVNEEDAALAYNEKAKELFGEFARLNEVK